MPSLSSQPSLQPTLYRASRLASQGKATSSLGFWLMSGLIALLLACVIRFQVKGKQNNDSGEDDLGDIDFESDQGQGYDTFVLPLAPPPPISSNSFDHRSNNNYSDKNTHDDDEEEEWDLFHFLRVNSFKQTIDGEGFMVDYGIDKNVKDRYTSVRETDEEVDTKKEVPCSKGQEEGEEEGEEGDNSSEEDDEYENEDWDFTAALHLVDEDENHHDHSDSGSNRSNNSSSSSK